MSEEQKPEDAPIETEANMADVPVGEAGMNGTEHEPAPAGGNVDPDRSEAEANAATATKDMPPVHAHKPNFANLSNVMGDAPASLSRFLDVSVQVSAELGNIRMPIGEILQLGEGSVIELNRALSEPVDLVAQGVRIARGEVVVIDDCFAIRIKEIESENET